MIELKVEKINDKLEKHYAEDENGVKYKILQVGTGIEYDEAVDLIPCKFTYVATTTPVENTIQ